MAEQNFKSLSIANPHPPFTDNIQKLGAAIGGIGFLILVLASFGVNLSNQGLWLIMSLLFMASGIVIYSWRAYLTKAPGIKNNGVWFSSISNRGLWGWVIGIILTGFYVLLYWYPQLLGQSSDGNEGLVGLFDPLSMWIKNQPASQWFVYGTLYTVAIVFFGIKFIWKYRHNKYQVLRTISVMFFQLFFAYLIPEIMESLNSDTAVNWFDKDLKNMWPLDYDFFFDWHVTNMGTGGLLGSIALIFGVLMIFIISPILTYKYGKRWYCSWVCGCGGLAETAGDPFRHLSDKSLRAWKIERWVIHLVLLFSFVMTIAAVYSYLGTDPEQYYLTRNQFSWIVIVLLIISAGGYIYLQRRKSDFKKRSFTIVIGAVVLVLAIFIVNYIAGLNQAFFIDAGSLKGWYGFYIGAIFSGIIGVGFYPIMGSRVWCRFGCPMAAMLGIQQKLFSRFRITTNGSQCISCGNCSTYCEMGIDVRWYAQRGQDIVRASCVGCGICSAVCPRGVLRLENGSVDIHDKAIDLRAVHVKEEEVRILN